jgi:hypothetical protein
MLAGTAGQPGKQKAAPRNFDAFFAKGQKKTVKIPVVLALRLLLSRLPVSGEPRIEAQFRASSLKGKTS